MTTTITPAPFDIGYLTWLTDRISSITPFASCIVAVPFVIKAALAAPSSPLHGISLKEPPGHRFDLSFYPASTEANAGQPLACPLELEVATPCGNLGRRPLLKNYFNTAKITAAKLPPLDPSPPPSGF